MNQLSKLSSLFLIVVAVLVAYLAGTCSTPDNDYEQQMKEWKQKAEVAIAFSDSIRKENERVRAEGIKRDSIADTQTKEINRLRSQADKQRQKNDELLDSLSRTLPDTCDDALNLAKGYRAEADSLRVALDSADVRDSVQKADIIDLRNVNAGLVVANDSLKKLINIVPEKKDTFLGIPKPSRKVTFIAGVILGGALAVYGDDITDRITRN